MSTLDILLIILVVTILSWWTLIIFSDKTFWIVTFIICLFISVWGEVYMIVGIEAVRISGDNGSKFRKFRSDKAIYR